LASAIGRAMEDAHKIEVDIIGNEGKKSLTGNDSSTFGGKAQKTLTAQLKKMVGIDVGIGALLKQSQIFTGYLGNLFAIVGALIDTVLAPLAPLAFKSLAKLGAIIPKLADMAAKYIPKIVDFVGKIFLNVDKFFKSFLQKDYAGKILRGLLVLIGINIGIRMLLLTGKAGGTILGLRQGGVLNMAARGGSRLLGAGGGGGGIGRALMAPVAATAAFGSRLFGRGGGSIGAGGTTTGGGGAAAGGGFMSRLFRRGGAPSQVPVRDVTSPTGWRMPSGSPAGGRFAAAPTGGGGIGIMGKLGKVARVGGTLFAGFSGYQGGREQDMSVGMSVGRGATAAATTFGGMKLGAAIGTAIAPGIGTAIGTVLGGLAGFAAGTGIFDKLFGKKDTGFNMDIGGQIGAAGYQAPFFIAEAQEYWSDQVRKSGMILDDFALSLIVAQQAAEDEANAHGDNTDAMEDWRDKGYDSFAEGTLDFDDYLNDWEAGIEAGIKAADSGEGDGEADGKAGGPMFEGPDADAQAAAAATAAAGIGGFAPDASGGVTDPDMQAGIDEFQRIQNALDVERRNREQIQDDKEIDDPSAFKPDFKPWVDTQAAQDAIDRATAVQDALNWEKQEQSDRDELARIIRRDLASVAEEQHLQDTQFRAQNILEGRDPTTKLSTAEIEALEQKDYEQEASEIGGAPMATAAVLDANRVAEENRLALEAWRADLYKGIGEPTSGAGSIVSPDFYKAEETDLIERMAQTLFTPEVVVNVNVIGSGNGNEDDTTTKSQATEFTAYTGSSSWYRTEGI